MPGFYQSRSEETVCRSLVAHTGYQNHQGTLAADVIADCGNNPEAVLAVSSKPRVFHLLESSEVATAPGRLRRFVVSVEPRLVCVGSRVISLDPCGKLGKVALQRPQLTSPEYRIIAVPCQGKGREFEPRLPLHSVI